MGIYQTNNGFTAGTLQVGTIRDGHIRREDIARPLMNVSCSNEPSIKTMVQKLIDEEKLEEADKDNVYAYMSTNEKKELFVGFHTGYKTIKAGMAIITPDTVCFSNELKGALESGRKFQHYMTRKPVTSLYDAPDFHIFKIKVAKENVVSIYTGFTYAKEFDIVEELSLPATISFKVENVYRDYNDKTKIVALVSLKNSVTSYGTSMNINIPSLDTSKEEIEELVDVEVTDKLALEKFADIEGDLI